MRDNFATWGRHYWPVFLIVETVLLFLGFGIPEAISLITERAGHVDNTLSYYARYELHVSVATANSLHTVAWWCSFSGWMLFVVFITGHIWFAQFG